jgi:hypothetical protein
MAMGSAGRTRWQVLAAGLLAWTGVVAIFYAPFLPLPPLGEGPVPLAWQVLGVAELAAAAGVFLGQAWGRTLGVGVVVVSLGFGLLSAAAEAPRRVPMEFIASVALDVVLAGVILWVLLRRWPHRPRASRE